MVRNDDECARAARQAGTLLQEIQGHLGNRNIAEAKVRFPRGFIRTAGYFQKTLLFISNDTLRCNLSYLWLETEVYRWILVRTDLYGPAREMLLKRLICLIGNAVESTMRGYYGKRAGKHAKYRKIVARLVDEKVIDGNLGKDLQWLWDLRNREHVFLNETLELNQYTDADLFRALNASNKLVERLDAVFWL